VGFFSLFFSLVGEGKKSSLCAPFKKKKKTGGLSQDERRLFSFAKFTFTLPMCSCSYFGNALMQQRNFMKSLYENKKTAKKIYFQKK